MSLPKYETIVNAFGDWNLAEHKRLHAGGQSVQSNLGDARRSAALPLSDVMNKPYVKTIQHLQRLRMRAVGLEEVGYHPDMVARVTSDSLKLMAGQQVKRALARAASQDDFIARVLLRDEETPLVVEQAYRQIAEAFNPAALEEEFDILHEALSASLLTIHDRAVTGQDWGEEKSPMVTATQEGEVACARFGIVVVGFVAAEMGGLQHVPLRIPAQDEAIVPNIFPFN
jgi:hypothetical protein